MGRGDWADSRRSEGLVGWGTVDQLGERVAYWCRGCSVGEGRHFTERRTTDIGARWTTRLISSSEVSVLVSGLKSRR